MALTPKELYSKIDYEGGIYEAITSYGLGVDDLGDDDPELKVLWVCCVRLLDEAKVFVDEFEDELLRTVLARESG